MSRGLQIAGLRALGFRKRTEISRPEPTPEAEGDETIRFSTPRLRRDLLEVRLWHIAEKREEG
jgi:hypothetical protein